MNLGIARPFEVSSDSAKLGYNILPGVKNQQNLKTQTLGGPRSIKTLNANDSRISEVSTESRVPFNQKGLDHSPMYQSTNQVVGESNQDDSNSMYIRSQERDKEVSESDSNAQEITLFGKRIKFNPVHTTEINSRLIETPMKYTLKLTEFPEGDRNTQEKGKYKQYLVDQHTNPKRKEIHQDELNTINLNSEESTKAGSKMDSTFQEVVSFGKKIKANPSHTMDIRNFATHKMNRLCMLYSRHLVEELTSSIISRFKREKGLQYQPDLIKQYNTSLFAPFVYFILLRDPKKAVWDRLLSTTSSIMVEFHKQETRLGEASDSQKLYKFMLWHTEMMYHLTNPMLLDHFNKYQDIFTQSSITEINKGRCPISAILSMVASKVSFERLFERSQGISRLSASYLKAYWSKDYEYNYPVSRKSNILQSSIKKEWKRISQLILESCTLRNSFEFFLGLAELNLDEPIIGANSMMLALKNTEDPTEFKNDLIEVREELNQENIRQDLAEIRDSSFFKGLNYWMQNHEKQKMKFSDPFCVTAILNFLGSKSPGLDLDLFWKDMQENEVRRKAYCAEKSEYYHRVRKIKISKAKKDRLDGSQSQES